jgi:hypothetical protein
VPVVGRRSQLQVQRRYIVRRFRRRLLTMTIVWLATAACRPSGWLARLASRPPAFALIPVISPLTRWVQFLRSALRIESSSLSLSACERRNQFCGSIIYLPSFARLRVIRSSAVGCASGCSSCWCPVFAAGSRARRRCSDTMLARSTA